MKLDENKMVKVINRTDGALGYKIDSMGITRVWSKPGDYLNISLKELMELKTVTGGVTTLKEHLLIKEESVLDALFPGEAVEPEYNYGKEEVIHILQEGSLEQLLDTLDYAPKGVIDLIRGEAVRKLPNTTAKVEAINDYFKINLATVHELNKDKATTTQTKRKKPARRTEPVVVDEKPKKSKYKVVSREVE